MNVFKMKTFGAIPLTLWMFKLCAVYTLANFVKPLFCKCHTG